MMGYKCSGTIYRVGILKQVNPEDKRQAESRTPEIEIWGDSTVIDADSNNSITIG